MSFWRSTELPTGDNHGMEPDEIIVLEKVATKVVERQMTVPAIVFLESVKPLNFIGSQTMVFFEPIVQSVFNFKDYDTLRTALEKRQSIEVLIQKIEAKDALVLAREKRIKAFMKIEKKKWKWYQRYLGILRPRIAIPDEVLNPPPPTPKPEQP